MEEVLSVAATAEFLGITEARVKRLARESLLSSAGDDKEQPVFKSVDVKRYKELAERIGGI
ncbi:MAG: helix-turn-helix domain-containing protein [Gammaproteobacteria bacterium]|nr:helix-turn-helix domain-containing protein [Gammaproteobacteria bacterium]